MTPPSVAHGKPPICGTVATGPLAEPPNVDVWKQPLDANGLHEVVLAVHNDEKGARFCYRYRANGVVQTKSPALHVHAGERFAIRIVNDISSQSKGEFVSSRDIPPCKPMPMPSAPVAHYSGYLHHTIEDRYLPMTGNDTNIHLHGFQGPPSQEDIFLSTLSTPMHACEYAVTIPATQPPGTYFYHSHAHGSGFNEMAGGLSGAWIVDPTTPQLPRSAQHVIVIRYQLPFATEGSGIEEAAIDDAAAEHLGSLPLAPHVPYDAFNPPPWPVTYPMKIGSASLDATGCTGSMAETVVTVDGTKTPASLDVVAGQTQLLRLVDGTSDSPKLLRLVDSRGRTIPMRVAEIDGIPVSGNTIEPLSEYLPEHEVMLAPASRADVEVTLAPGQTASLDSEPYCDGADGFRENRQDLLDIRAIRGATPFALAASPLRSAQTPAAKLIAYARTHPILIRRRAITFTEYTIPKHGAIPEHPAYYVTETSNPNFRETPFWPTYAASATVPSNPNITVRVGTIEEWYLINTTLEVHAFHIHQITTVDEDASVGIPITEDTVFVPVGTVLPNPQDPNYPLIQPSITRVLLDFRHSPRGTYVFHCHMMYHEDNGMMATIKVI